LSIDKTQMMIIGIHVVMAHDIVIARPNLSFKIVMDYPSLAAFL
jgi:hypothetical protein